MVKKFRIFQQLGSIGRSILNMYQSYILTQIRTERLTRDVADAEQEVAKAQNLYNQYLRDFGEDSAYTLQAYDDLQNALKRLEDKQKDLKKASDEKIYLDIGLTLEALGTIGSIGNLLINLNKLKNMGTITLGIKTALATAGLGLGALLGLGLVSGGLAYQAEQERQRTEQYWKQIPPWLLGPYATEEARRQAITSAGAIQVPWLGPFWVPETPTTQILPSIPERYRTTQQEFLETAKTLKEAYQTVSSTFNPFISYNMQWGGYGIVSKPTLFLAGERGAETFSFEPLSKQRFEPQIRDMRINTYIENVSTEMDAERIGEIAYKKLMQKLEGKA